MKAGAYFEQRANSSAHGDRASSRLGHARENLQKRAFARTIPPHNAEHFAFFQIERDILQCPDIILVHAPVGFSDHRFCQTNGRRDRIHDHVAQHVIAEFRLRRADLVLLTDVFY